MRITCPRCLRSLSAADPGGPPAFCMYCGQKLRDSTAHPAGVLPAVGEMPTTDLVPFTDNPEDTAEAAGPAQVGGYRLLRKLGSGGMGTVYEAEAPGAGGRVAVKLLSPRLSANPASVERFRQEGRLASQLSHPRCVFVLAADTDAGRPYIVMELMPGRTLKDLVDARGPLPPAEAIAHTLDVVDGLAEAHRLGVLHRDVKPSNCFLTADGRVKVGDFGLSKSLVDSADRQITQSGAFLGTVLFASPEQLKSEPLDYTSDVYSVCATLYYLLCGEPPYHHESVTAALLKTAEGPPESLCARRPAVSRALERIVLRGLEQDRARRWQTLDELRDALAALLPGKQVPARPRSLVGAYVLDCILLLVLVQAPVELAGGLLGETDVRIGVTNRFHPVEWGLYTLYFAVLEGLLGTTLGKWLLRLRVSRVGQTGPPGLRAGLIRAGVFNLVLVAVFYSPVVGPAGAVLAVLGLAALLLQLRKTPAGYRGVHDLASGCHVTRRPHPPRKMRLLARRASPLDELAPADPDTPLPEAVGGFAVKGRVWAADGEEVWAAEDRALGRRVLLRLRAGEPEEPDLADGGGPGGPARLRR
ncbi:MAG: protein kinase, partial [Gemmataceae bacterium]|nr:protein kinase [Gemmataceae bacterium]